MIELTKVQLQASMNKLLEQENGLSSPQSTALRYNSTLHK